jgi:hypothetical protein
MLHKDYDRKGSVAKRKSGYDPQEAAGSVLPMSRLTSSTPTKSAFSLATVVSEPAL